MVDAVALLDMLLGFAELCGASDHPFVRPVLAQSGPLQITAGRHPVIASLPSFARATESRSGFVPNDASITPLLTFLCITGPNGSVSPLACI